MAKLSVCLAVAVALGLTFCGSADAFVVVAPVGASTPVVRASMPTPGGMMAGGKSCSSGAFPVRVMLALLGSFTYPMRR